MKNRSVPADVVLPHLVYQDVAAAIEWLSRTFGFVEHYRYGDPAQGAQIVENLHETMYGERQYGVEDLGGHRWLFSRHARDVSPGEWGAVVAR